MQLQKSDSQTKMSCVTPIFQNEKTVGNQPAYYERNEKGVWVPTDWQTYASQIKQVC